MTRFEASLSSASTSESNFTNLSALKYNRMRQLNNQSSRKCRKNIKLKRELMLKELEEQKVHRLFLERKCEDLEIKVRKLKSYVLKNFENPQKEVALDRQRLVFGHLVSTETLFFEHQSLPEISSIWSDLSRL